MATATRRRRSPRGCPGGRKAGGAGPRRSQQRRGGRGRCLTAAARVPPKPVVDLLDQIQPVARVPLQAVVVVGVAHQCRVDAAQLQGGEVHLRLRHRRAPVALAAQQQRGGTHLVHQRHRRAATVVLVHARRPGRRGQPVVAVVVGPVHGQGHAAPVHHTVDGGCRRKTRAVADEPGRHHPAARLASHVHAPGIDAAAGHHVVHHGQQLQVVRAGKVVLELVDERLAVAQ